MEAGRLAGWGRQWSPGREVRGENLAALTRDVPLTRGLGRSYGDASLPPEDRPVAAGSRLADRILELDQERGRLRAEAGVSLHELTRILLPLGWAMPVVTGTGWVTLGGMVASDVHGKNHHVDGSIGRWVDRLVVRTAAGDIVSCSREEEPDLFRGCLGGMGLLGHLLEVEVRLRRIPSPWILQEVHRIRDLDHFLLALGQTRKTWPYTVGWIDTLKSGKAMGRGLLMAGRWAEPAEGPREAPGAKRLIPVPFECPDWALSPWTMRVFNALYYGKQWTRVSRGIVHPQSFFHPLDVLHEWNRIYGKRGMTQYQCVIPSEVGPAGVTTFLREFVRLGEPSFLSVIKDLGEEGEGLLSFPRPGTTLNLDLPVRSGTQKVVDRLNEIVIELGGRIYLAKDSLTRRDHFVAMEGLRLEHFEAARDRWDPEHRLGSALSRRLFDRRGGRE